MGLLTPLLYGIGTGLPLVVGAMIGSHWKPPDKYVAMNLAFASGSLITGLAFELFEPAVQSSGLWLTTGAFLVGTGLYVRVKYFINARRGSSGSALLTTVIIDGLAENFTLGVVLAGGSAGGPLAILAGVAANNLPEAIGGTTSMRENGKSFAWTMGIWTVTASGLVLVVLAGYTIFAGTSETLLSLVRAVGGGAVLASVTVEIMPAAYERGGPAVAFATAAGFILTFILI